MLINGFINKVRSLIPAMQIRRNKHTVGSCLMAIMSALVVMMLPLSQLQAQALKTEYQYAVKLVCSGLLPHQDGDLARGIYRTAVNIHNPTEKKVPFAFKVVVANSINDEPGSFSVTQFRDVTLQPDGAAEITCFDVFGFFCPTPEGVCIDFAFLNGFAVLKTPVELDVVGVYTARHTDGEVESIDLETINPRKITADVKPYTDAYKGEIKKRIPYPYGPAGNYGNQMCGGIAAIPCPNGKVCTDDPSDSCNPDQGGADCPGICVNEIVTK